jgi:molecular chaperone DnaK
MAQSVVGVDFGTTNSLVARIDNLGRVRSLTNVDDDRPHPSTVWYRAGDVIVGRDARKHLESGSETVSGSFVRSPKRLLFNEAPVDVDGTQRDPVDIVAEVLRFLKQDACASARGDAAVQLERAVVTIPVDLDGDGRRRLRDAAKKAGIGIVQFVHEPLAALYAWLRSNPDCEKACAEMDGRRILVFDWGGGTLDLTLCMVKDGQLLQITSRGDNEVGGDFFDDLIRNKVRELHAADHGIEDIQAFETAESRTRLLAQCEQAKIRLSTDPSFTVFVPNYLRCEDGKHLRIAVTREQLGNWTDRLVDRGLAHIDRLLEDHGLTHQEIELCLPTGGMVNIPAVRDGLVQRFGGRVPKLSNGDRIIAEGAAWVASDALRLALAKPIELRQPNGSFVEIVGKGLQLPFENQCVPVANTQFYCVDPRDGVAHLQFVRPAKVGYGERTSPRLTYKVVSLEVDPNAQPFLERLNVKLLIDHDYIVRVEAHSSVRGDEAMCEIHDLEFALRLPRASDANDRDDDEDVPGNDISSDGDIRAAIQLRSNVTDQAQNWHLVPGDVIETWRPNWFDRRSRDASARQREERDYYRRCATCKRTSCQITFDGCIECKLPPSPSGLGSRTGARPMPPNN